MTKISLCMVEGIW